MGLALTWVKKPVNPVTKPHLPRKKWAGWPPSWNATSTAGGLAPSLDPRAFVNFKPQKSFAPLFACSFQPGRVGPLFGPGYCRPHLCPHPPSGVRSGNHVVNFSWPRSGPVNSGVHLTKTEMGDHHRPGNPLSGAIKIEVIPLRLVEWPCSGPGSCGSGTRTRYRCLCHPWHLSRTCGSGCRQSDDNSCECELCCLCNSMGKWNKRNISKHTRKKWHLRIQVTNFSSIGRKKIGGSSKTRWCASNATNKTRKDQGGWGNGNEVLRDNRSEGHQVRKPLSSQNLFISACDHWVSVGTSHWGKKEHANWTHWMSCSWAHRGWWQNYRMTDAIKLKHFSWL